MTTQTSNTSNTRTAPGLPENPRFVPGFITIQDLQVQFQCDGDLIRDLIRDQALATKGAYLAGRFSFPVKVNADKGIAAEDVAAAREQLAAVRKAVRKVLKAQAKVAATSAA